MAEYILASGLRLRSPVFCALTNVTKITVIKIVLGDALRDTSRKVPSRAPKALSLFVVCSNVWFCCTFHRYVQI